MEKRSWESTSINYEFGNEKTGKTIHRRMSHVIENPTNEQIDQIGSILASLGDGDKYITGEVMTHAKVFATNN